MRAEGFEPPEHKGNRVTAGPTSPSVARPRGVSDGIRTREYWHHKPAPDAARGQTQYPRQGSNLRTSWVWTRRSPQTELHGHMPASSGVRTRHLHPCSRRGAVRRVRIELDHDPFIRRAPPTRWTPARRALAAGLEPAEAYATGLTVRPASNYGLREIAWRGRASNPHMSRVKAGRLYQFVHHAVRVVFRDGVEPPASAVSGRRSDQAELPEHGGGEGSRTLTVIRLMRPAQHPYWLPRSAP